MTRKEAEDAGFVFKVINNHVNNENRQLITFEIITPGDFGTDDKLPTYQDYVDGKHMPGYVGCDETFVIGVKTKVRNNILDDSEINTTEDFWNDSVWDKEFKADGFTTVDDVNGDYLKELNPDGGFESLTDIGKAGITYERTTSDNRMIRLIGMAMVITQMTILRMNQVLLHC